MRAYVGVTDNRWAAFLRERPELSEVNFWRPSAQNEFKVIANGAPFLFKTHKPENRLVGGGFLSGAPLLRVSEAWDFFGEGNGVSSEAELQSLIAAYRRRNGSPPEPDPLIRCILLRDVFFVAPDDTAPAPPDWAPNLVQGRSYDITDSPIEAALTHLLQHKLPAPPLASPEASHVDGPMWGDPRLIAPRLGQQAFRGMVLAAYDRRCAITGSRISPVLQSAHIRPVTQQGEHRLDNGLLLRSDVHTLFDRGYLGLDEKHRLNVSPRLREDYGNGREFYERAGSTVLLPARVADRPSKASVQYHMDVIFKR